MSQKPFLGSFEKKKISTFFFRIFWFFFFFFFFFFFWFFFGFFLFLAFMGFKDFFWFYFVIFYLYCISSKNIILIFRIQGSISQVYVLCDDGFPTDLLIVSHTEEGYEYCYLLSRALAIAENQLAIYQYLFNMFLDLNRIPRM